MRCVASSSLPPLPPLFLFLLFPPTEVKATLGTKKEPKEKKKNRTFASSFHSPERVAKSGRGFCMYIKEMLLCTKARVVGGRILLWSSCFLGDNPSPKCFLVCWGEFIGGNLFLLYGQLKVASLLLFVLRLSLYRKSLFWVGNCMVLFGALTPGSLFKGNRLLLLLLAFVASCPPRLWCPAEEDLH